MLIEHRGKRPNVHPSAYVAPTATLCGDVTVGEESRVLFGAVLVAEGGPVEVGASCIVMENAVLRGTPGHPLRIGDHVLVGPRAHLTGCRVEDCVFLATGATVFTGARIGSRAEVRINGVVHLLTVLPPDAVVPIGWVAVGDPARVLPPGEHDEIWKIQEGLDFPQTVYGVSRGTAPRELMQRQADWFAAHRDDRVL